MDRSQMLEKIREAFVDQVNVDGEAVVESAALIDDLGADSLDLLQLVTELEDQFDISIPDEDFEAIKTVGDVLDEIEKLAG